MSEFAYQVKIPKERIAVLIGKKGETKKQIEETLKIKLEIDSHEGDINILGTEAIDLYSAREIVRAIGRGFSPETALLLLKQDYAFEIITLPETDKKSHMTRVKGRIIGKEGKTRELIEEHTDTSISVYGKTISIIGRIEKVETCRRAVEMLVQGSMHSTVYRWLEKMRSSSRDRGQEDITPYLRTAEDRKVPLPEEIEEENYGEEEDTPSP
jgi:ribosomal RNA assembly protein